MASRTGETLTAAVIVALRERLARLKGKRRRRLLRDELRDIARRCAALPTLDDRPADEEFLGTTTGLTPLMVLDTSALLALLLDEPEAEAYRVALEDDETRLVSAATLLETAIVIEARKGEAGGRELDLLIHKADIAVVAVDAGHVAEARRAYRRFGRGRHAARLNFGDVFAYHARAGVRRGAVVQGRGLLQDRHQAGDLTRWRTLCCAVHRGERRSDDPAGGLQAIS